MDNQEHTDDEASRYSEDLKPLAFSGDKLEEGTATQRVLFILDEDLGDEKNECCPLFSEMEELVTEGEEMEWKETARWIKFEENVEEGGNRWSKPHVGTLSLHSLFELRNSIENGTIILDMHADSMEQLANSLLDHLISNNSLAPNEKIQVKEALLKKHRHQHQRIGTFWPIVTSFTDIGRNYSARRTKRKAVNKKPKSEIEELENKKLKKNGSYSKVPGSERNDTIGNSDNTSPINKNERHTDLCKHEDTLQHNQHFMKKIPNGSEASNILVGKVNFLTKAIAAFVRLNPAMVLDDLTEVPVPTRFLFLLLVPSFSTAGFREIGRAMSTLMTDEIFREVAYKARNKSHLLAGVDEFLNAVTVLPPGEWDPSIRIEPPSSIPSQDMRKRSPMKQIEELDEEEGKRKLRENSGLVRTGVLFGGLINDIKRKTPWYISDFKDALASQCIASWIFLYFACLSPIITFGGLLSQATGKNMAAMESLVSGFICGMGYGLFSGQPLTILGSTGPVLVFETIVYDFCGTIGWDYMSFRFWVGTWIAVILLVLVAIDASALVCYITRFTEESFATLIAVIFIFKAIENVLVIGKQFPTDESRNSKMGQDCDCYFNDSTRLNYSGIVNWTADEKNSCMELNGTLSEGCFSETHGSEVFLMSVILFLGTFLISVHLKDFKNALFFSSRVRQFVSDFAVIIAIVSMTLLDAKVGIMTPKLEVPKEFKPTSPDRGWIIPPFQHNPLYSVFVAFPPALLGTILIFMDQQITTVIVNRQEHKLNKGCGYHLDLFVLSILIAICSLMGLPWFVAATVLSINHVNSLKLESECTAPGEKPQFLGVREQRVTHILIFLTIGLSVFLTPMLGYIPMPVLFGVFLYMGVSSLGGLQFFDRILIMFMPTKYQPDLLFLRQVPINRVHLFTIIQIICLVCLWSIKSFSATSILFPLMLVVIIGIRKSLDFIFSKRELKILDDVMPEITKKHEILEEEELRGIGSKLAHYLLGPRLIMTKSKMEIC